MRRFITTFGILFALAAPSNAQTDPATAELASGIAQLNATLLEMKELLALQLENQGLDLLLKRGELMSRQTTQLENLLRSTRAIRESAEQEVAQLRSEREMMQAQLRSRQVEVEEQEQMVAWERQIELRIEQAEQRLATAEREEVDLQSRLDARQRDLRAWEDLIDRRLSGI